MLQIHLTNQGFDRLYKVFHKTEEKTKTCKVPIDDLKHLLHDHSMFADELKKDVSHYFDQLQDALDNTRAGAKMCEVPKRELGDMLSDHSIFFGDLEKQKLVQEIYDVTD